MCRNRAWHELCTILVDEEAMRSSRKEAIVSQEQNNQGSQRARGNNLGVGIGLGIAIGAAIGILMDNLAMGVAVGIAIGVAIGMAIDQGRKRGGS
jgi:F0F1-type ATP synthase assembly protein I